MIQSFRAFGSGGLFGTGIGMGAMKYSYLPEAHNDFILAVIGEECGLVGMVLVIALFALILWSGFRIARNAPDFFGSLLAAGSSMLIVFTFLLNLSGVIGAFPLSGKAVPFLSYGGTSMMASLLVVGTILSVSVHSRLPETVHDRRRRSLGVVRDGAPAPVPTVEGSTAGAPTARSLRLVHDSGSRGDARRGDPGAGGRSGDRGGGREGSGRDGSHPEARRTRDSSGRERIELGRSATERLRPERGPEVRERRGPSSRNTGRR